MSGRPAYDKHMHLFAPQTPVETGVAAYVNTQHGMCCTSRRL